MARKCSACGAEMVPDVTKKLLVCSKEEKHPKVKLPDSKYP